MAQLTILDGKFAGTVFELTSGQDHEVGTARRAEVRITERGVSYNHARFEADDEGGFKMPELPEQLEQR